MCPVDIWNTCSAAFTMRSILIDRWYEPIASANRFARELVTPDEFSVPMKVVCRTWPAISSGADGTQRELPSSLRQTRRQSLATSPSGSSREALVTRMHITATMAATEDESAPPARREGSNIDVFSQVNGTNRKARAARIRGFADMLRYMINYRSAIKSDVSIYIWFWFSFSSQHGNRDPGVTRGNAKD